MTLSENGKADLKLIQGKINAERVKLGLEPLTQKQAVEACLDFIKAQSSAYIASVFIKGY